MRDEIVPPTPEWLAQHEGRVHIDTDPNGKFVGAARKDTTLLAWLLRREILTESHAYYAMVFLDMRHYFRRKVGYRPNNMYALEFFGSNNSGVLETIYLRVCRKIMGENERLLNYAMEMEADDTCRIVRLAKDPDNIPNMKALAASCERITDAFDALVQAIDEARKDVDRDE